MATAKAEINRNFASAIDASGNLVFAPAYIMVGGRLKLHPTADDYAAHTPPYWPVVDVTPSPDTAPANCHWEARGWTRDAERQMFVRQYEAVQDPPPPPRRWSRLAIKTALAQAEMLAAARAYLAQVEIATGYTAWEALTDCDYIEEGFPTAERWGTILDGAASALGKTRAEIDAFLSQIPTEGAL